MSDRRRRSSLVRDAGNKPPVNPEVRGDAKVPGRPTGRPGARAVAVRPVNPKLVDKQRARPPKEGGLRKSSKSPVRIEGGPSGNPKGKRPPQNPQRGRRGSIKRVRIRQAPLPKRSARRPPTARTKDTDAGVVIYTPSKARLFLNSILEFLRAIVRPSAPKPGQGKRGSLLQPPLAGPSTEPLVTVADIIRSTIPQELLNLFRVPDAGPSTAVGGFTIPAPNPENSETDITTEEVFSSVLGPAMARAILSIPQALQRIPFPTRILDVLAEIGNYLYLLVNQDQITYLGLIEDIELTPYLDMEYSEVYCQITNVIQLLKERIKMIDESGYEIICNILFIRNFILYRVSKNQVISIGDLEELERLANNVGVAVREYFDLDKVRLVISEETANATRETVEDIIETYRTPREQGDEGAGTGAFF